MGLCLWCLLYVLGPWGLHGFCTPVVKRLHRNRYHMVDAVSEEEIVVDNKQGQESGTVAEQCVDDGTKTNIQLKKTIGIDYGLARTGLAMSGGYAAAQPLQILEGLEIHDEIIHTMQLYGLEQIVLGWPIEKNGTIADQALLTREFGMTLKERVCRQLGDVPLFLCDERYTSKAARATLENSKEGLERVDAVAACMILDSFFGGEKVTELVLPENTLEECLAEYAERKSEAEAEKKAAMEYRDLQRQRRKDAIARDQQLLAENGPSKKKKKKKRKR